MFQAFHCKWCIQSCDPLKFTIWFFLTNYLNLIVQTKDIHFYWKFDLWECFIRKQPSSFCASNHFPPLGFCLQCKFWENVSKQIFEKQGTHTYKITCLCDLKGISKIIHSFLGVSFMGQWVWGEKVSEAGNSSQRRTQGTSFL